MGKSYPSDAVDQCLRLYLKYNGQQHDRIEQEMRKLGWGGWRKQNLYTRGKGRAQKLGWIEKFGWEKALQLHLAQKPTATLNNAEKLVREVETVRDLLYAKIRGHGADVEKETLQLHRDYCNLSIAALTKVEAARDTLGAFVSFGERLLDWLVDIDARTAKALLKVWEQIIERAEKEFGETEEMVEGVMWRKDGSDENQTDTTALAGTED